MRMILAAMAAGCLAVPAAADHHESADHSEQTPAHMALVAAVEDDGRGDDGARDQYRHPVETIEFMRIEPGMKVLDYFPGGGWYTKILVPYLGADGSYVGGITTLSFSTEEQQARQNAFPEAWPERVRENWTGTGAPITAINTTNLPEGLDGTFDRVLIVRMLHNLHRWGLAHQELTKLRNLLKDDGMLGIVQHRAKEDAPYSYANGSNGYVRQSDVIKLVEAHGFELVATSEINANPKDPANHEGGVWNLPPTLANEDAAMAAIGESDRMTLLFRKRP